MILLKSGLPINAMLLYREPTDDSNILHTPLDLYESWNKPEKAKEWRAKLPIGLHLVKYKPRISSLE